MVYIRMLLMAMSFHPVSICCVLCCRSHVVAGLLRNEIPRTYRICEVLLLFLDKCNQTVDLIFSEVTVGSRHHVLIAGYYVGTR